MEHLPVRGGVYPTMISAYDRFVMEQLHAPSRQADEIFV